MRDEDEEELNIDHIAVLFYWRIIILFFFIINKIKLIIIIFRYNNFVLIECLFINNFLEILISLIKKKYNF